MRRNQQRGPRKLRVEPLEAREMLSADSIDSLPEAPTSPLRYQPGDPYYKEPFGGRRQWIYGPRLVSTGIRGANIEAAWDQLIRWERNIGNNQPIPSNLNRALFAFGGDATFNTVNGVDTPTGINRRPVFAIVDNGVQLDHPDLVANMLAFPDSFDCTIDPRLKLPDGGPGPPGGRHFTLNAHGTAVTGIAAADRDNGAGISGVAPEAFWSSHRLLLTLDPSDPVTSARNSDIGEATCLGFDPIFTQPGPTQTAEKDIYINAWGPVDATDWRTTAAVPGNITRGAILGNINFGRPYPPPFGPTLGTIYVWAGGNGREFGDRVDYDQYASNRFSIAVASIDQSGNQSQYSEEGASVFIAAPSSTAFQTPGDRLEILTTDIHVIDPLCPQFFPDQADYGGYNWHTGVSDPRNNLAECNIWPNDEDPFPDLAYTNYGHWSPFDSVGGFGGTSGAAPVVAGIIALMLDGRDDGILDGARFPLGQPTGILNTLELTYRDVQHILATSAYRTGGTTGWARNDGIYEISPDPDPGSTFSIGAHINHKYGFGAIDALKAVQTSYNWPGVSDQFYFTSGTLAVQRQPFDPPGSIGRRIPDNTGQSVGQIFTVLPGQTWTQCAIQRWNDCQGTDVEFPNNMPPIEWVEVTLESDHAFGGDLEITLIGPNGTRAEFAKQHASAEPYTNWKFVTPRFWGEDPLGNWNLQIKDVKSGDIGNWLSWQISFFSGVPFTVDDALPPAGSPDTAMALSNSFQLINVVANDGPRVDTSTVEIVTPPNQMGQVIALGNGQVRYRSRPGYVGTETFTYLVRNRFGLASAPITVTVTVTAPPPDPADPPVAANDTFSTPVNTAAILNILNNDSDPDRGDSVDPTTVSIVSQPTAGTGTVAVNANGTVTFTPANLFIGDAQFSYRVEDTTGLLSNVATVTVRVTTSGVTIPQAVNDVVATPANTAIVINVLANDTSPESPFNVATVAVVTAPNPAHGTAAVNTTTGRITFTPAAGFFGGATFAYNVRDQRGFLSNTATVSVAVKAPPQALNDSGAGFEIPEGTIGLLSILTNDFDPDGTLLPSSVVIVTPPQHGTVTINRTTGLATYTPDCEFAGADTFTYIVGDNEGQLSNVATVTIVLTEVQDPPTAVDDTVRTAADTPVVIDIQSGLLANDQPGDQGDTFNASSFRIPAGGGPNHGTANVNLATGQVTYTPDAGFTGGDSFTYFIRDNDGLTSNAGTARIRVGDPVSISGRAYIDTNLNGQFDAGEIPVQENEIVITVSDGLYTHSQSVRTDATGAFSAIDNPFTGLLLPRGTYSIAQVQPGLLIDGIDTPGTPAAVVGNNVFSGIVLSPGQSASGFLFGEQRFRSEFSIVNPASSRLYVASASISDTDDNPFGTSTPLALDLSQGNIWLSFDRGLSGRYAIDAISADGAIRLDVFNNTSFQTPVATSGGAASSAHVEFNGTTAPQFLKVSGSGSLFQVTVTPLDPCEPSLASFPATLAVSSSQWSGPFLGALAAQGLGNSGFDVPGGTVDQFNPLPWTNIDQISVRFSQPVTAGPGSISVRGTNSGTIPVQNFTYDSSTNTGAWTLSQSIGTDRILVDLSAIPESFDLRGLDSGPEQFRLNVLAGDVNRNARATIADAVAVRNRVGTSVGNVNYSVLHDLDGSGTIDVADRTLALLNVFATLPATQVAASPAAPAALVVTANNATPPSLPANRPEIPRGDGSSALRTSRRPAGQRAVDAALDSLVPASGLSQTDSASRLRARRTHRPGTVSSAVDSIFGS
jgi:subtilisin-like proprotein convertase family protein